MKYEMKHAKKPEKKSKARFNRKKIIAIISGSMATVAVIVLCFLYYEIIFSFIDSKIDAISNWFSGSSSVEDSDVSDVSVETAEEDDSVKDNTEEELPEETEEPEEEKAAPTIKLEVYQNATLETGVCYWRIRAVVTGDPAPEIKWNKDDSLGFFGDKIAQVNLNDPGETFTLTATATNSEGNASDSINLSWGCNSRPVIKGISLSEDILYVGKQYQAFVDVSDPENDVLSFSWSVSGGSVADSTVNPIKWSTPGSPGDYQVSVVVNDGHGNTAESSVAVYVGEVTTEHNTKNITIPKKTGEGGYIEYGGGTYIGGNIYAGDSDGNKPCSGFISFNISDLGGSIVESASLKLSGASISGDPLEFLKMLNINVLDWGPEPITQGDFESVGIFVASYNSPGITCNVSKLKEELQKAINEGKSRFQIRVRFGGPYTDNDGQDDGWGYSQASVVLNATIVR